jgi:glycosyltransferase involved in cell wall biosynthesis
MTNPIGRPGKSALANKLRRAWYRRAFRQATRILLIDETARSELVDSATTNKLTVVDNPYVTDAMLAAGEAPREAESGGLLAIGRLVPQKNYALMLAALGRLREISWRLDILGDGPLRPQLERQARDLGIADRVRFRGYVSDPLPYLRRASALLLTSRWEGQGAVLLEALACGCPVVATRSSAAVGAALGEGRYGRLTPADAVEPFADAVRGELESPYKISGTRQWIERYRVASGVQSHARVLGLR